MAESFTDNLKLSKRDTGDLNWGAGANANLDVVDGHAQLKNLRPPRTLNVSLGSGGVGANLTGSTTYFYKITSINELGETTENKIPIVTEAQITEPASPVPIILSWETVPGATGYKIYKGTSANSELLLVQVAGGATAVFTDTGNTATQAGQNVPALNTALLSVTGVRKQGEASPLRGDVKLEAGPNVVLTQDPVAGKITIEATGGSGGVTSVRKEGEAVGLLGDVKLRAGSNIALTQDGPGNAVEIAATGGGGVTSLRKFGDPTGLTGDVKIDQGSDITVAQDVPNNKIVVNYSGPKGYATVIAPAPNGSNDTANLQAALDAIPAASGGRVILREGEYIVDTLTISRFGTHLVGSGTGHENILTVPSGTRIRLTGLFTSNVQCNAEASMIENISFVCDTMGQNSSAVNCASTNIKVKHCSFTGIRLTRNAIRIISSAVMSEIHDSIFIFSGTESIGGAVSQIAIKIEQTDRVEVQGCKFLFQTPAPASATLTVKAIEFTRVNHARISDCRAYAGSVPANTTYIFAELVHATSIAGNIAITGNVVRGLNYFIRQNTQYQKVTVSGNNYTNHQGAGAAIDLASGNVEWAIVGNVLDGTTGVNLQSGADNNVVMGNKAVVVNAGTGNTVASTFVTSFRKTGDVTGLTGAVSIDQGSDISVTQDVPNNKLVVSYSGPKGYATVIAPVPNGTNDTTNLQTALDAIPSGTGGVVILREGVYRVDSLTLQRTGTRLVGSGSGRDLGSDSKGTQIRSTGFSGDILKVQASNVTIENITFFGTQLPDSFAIISGNPSIQITRCEIRGCIFDGIRAPLDGIRLPLVLFLSILDCQFWMSEVAAQSISRTPNAIKIGPTTFGFSLDNILIADCMFRINYPNPTAGTITAKAIDLTKVKSAVIANCEALGVNADANRTYIFLELKQDGGIGTNAVVKGNSISSFTHLIKQTSGFPLVAVGSNVLSNPIGTAFAVDLAGGNLGWAITGNVFDGN